MTKRSIVTFTLFGVVAAGCGGIRNLGDRVDAAADARRGDAGGTGAARDGRAADAPGPDRPVPDARPGATPPPDARADGALADVRLPDAAARDGAGDARIPDAGSTDAVAATPDTGTDTPGLDSAVDATADTAIADTAVDTAPPPVDAMVVAACPAGVSLEMLCATYCRGLTTACTGVSAQFPTEAACLATCTRPTWSCGTPGQTTGDTVFCRATHLGFAIALPPSAAAECSNAGPDSPTCR